MRIFPATKTAATACAFVANSNGSRRISRSNWIDCSALAPFSPLTPLQLLKSSRVRRFSTTDEEATAAAAGDDEEESFSTSYHAPVMWKECIDSLLAGDDHRESSILRRRHLGGGGHSEALLRQCRPTDVVFGCDVDPDALATASQRLAFYMTDAPDRPLFVPVQSNFCHLARVLPTVEHPDTGVPILGQKDRVIDGILLDLGVSSFQIDTAERGFAFMKDGPLDMRMSGNNKENTSSSALNAADICNEFDVAELSRILKVYGDEPRSKAVAKSIVQHRPLHTTADLVEAIATVVPQFAKQGRRQGRTATLARVFQALRIVVNQEDVVLEKALTEMAPTLLRPDGRLVVLSYHSMEDRMTKRVLRDGTIRALRPSDDQRDLYGNYIGTPRPFRTAGKARKAAEAEVELNSRARSATLRVGIRQEI